MAMSEFKFSIKQLEEAFNRGVVESLGCVLEMLERGDSREKIEEDVRAVQAMYLPVES